MSRPIFLNTLRGLRWHVFWFGVGLGAYAAMIVLFFPSVEQFMADAQYPEEILEFFGATGSMSDPRVFIQVEYLSFAPIILIMYGVLAGTGLMAGDEGRRTLEPLMAQPISRSAILVSRVAGLFAGLAGIYLLNLAGWLTTAPFVDLGEVGTLDLLAVTAASLPVTAAFTGLAILVAAISPARGVAAGIVSGLVVISYLIASFAQTVEAIAWTRWLSPYYYSNSHGLLTDGVVWWQQGLLVALALLTFGLAWLAFRGREIEAGVWQPRALARGWHDLTGR